MRNITIDIAKVGIITAMMAFGLWAQRPSGRAPVPVPRAVGVVDTVNTTRLVDTSRAVVDTINTASVVDTAGIVDTATASPPPARTARPGKAGVDTVDVLSIDDDELERAALAVDSMRISESPQKMDLIRREYEYKRQTRLAIVMMAFIALALASSQSWNPK